MGDSIPYPVRKFSFSSRPRAIDMTTTTGLPASEAASPQVRGQTGMTTRKRHIVSILLQNEVGALTRLTSLFSTRGYNIESLNVAPTDDPTVSRLTLVTSGTGAVIQQIVNQSLKLIDVVNVDDLTRDQHVERELLLLKLKTPPSLLTTLRACVQKAGGKILSDDPESFTVELTDSESQINRFIAEAGNFGEVLEVVRSGALAILRGATTLRA
jgi:acetolactate synthase I/III small subunit